MKGSSFTRIRATSLAMAALLALGAGLLPVCGGLCCPVTPDEATMHAQMPCCASRSSLAPMDAARVPPATLASGPAVHALIAATLEPSARAFAAEPPARAVPPIAAAQHDPSPPLFLRNAQLLI